MTQPTVRRAPGKLFLGGEYAVLVPGQPAIIAAVDRYIETRIESSMTGGSHARADIYPVGVEWHWADGGEARRHDGGNEDYLFSALSTFGAFLWESGRPVEKLPIDVTVDSELVEADGRKYGLGSSGAVVVSVLDALSAHYDLPLTNLELYKLALLATLRCSPGSSGGDVAASAFGGLIEYRSADRAVIAELQAAVGVHETVRADWPGLSIEPVRRPVSSEMLVGWTGSPASTGELVERAGSGAGRAAPFAVLAPADTQRFLTASTVYVTELRDACERDDADAIGAAVTHGRRVLGDFDALTGIGIETATLAALCDIAEQAGAAAKTSGAGGGDCGVAFTGSHTDIHRILTGWRSHGITRLRLSIADGRA